MTTIYDPIPFVKLVQTILVGNYDPIVGICGKMFIINLHILQMLFTLWIKYKFSECLAPLHKHEGRNRRLSGDGSAQACRHGGIHPQLSLSPLNFVVLKKFVLNIW